MYKCKCHDLCTCCVLLYQNNTALIELEEGIRGTFILLIYIIKRCISCWRTYSGQKCMHSWSDCFVFLRACQTRRLMDDQAEEFSIAEHFRIVGYAEQLFQLVYCIAVCCFFSLCDLSIPLGFCLQRFFPHPCRLAKIHTFCFEFWPSASCWYFTDKALAIQQTVQCRLLMLVPQYSTFV